MNTHYNDENCHYFSPTGGGKDKIYLIGDSYKYVIKKDLINNFIKNDYEVHDFVGDVYTGEVLYKKNGKILFNKTIDHIKNYETISGVKNKIFIYTQFLIGDLELNSFRDTSLKSDYEIMNVDKKILNIEDRKILLFNEINKIFNKILDNNNYLIIIYPWPEMKFNVPKEFLKEKYINFFDLKPNEEKKLEVDYKEFLKRQKEVIDFYDSFNSNKIIKIKPYEIFCNTIKKNKCISYDSSGFLYSDHYHLNEYGSTFINKKILDEINKIKNN